MRRVMLAVVAVALVAGGVAGGIALWQIDVPGGLATPSVDVASTFGARAVERAESFETFLLVTTLLAQVAVIATLVVYARRGAVLTRESAAGPIGTGFLLGMLGMALVWLVGLPFSMAELWWLRRHDVVNIGYVDAVIAELTGLGGTFLFLCLALLVAMGLATLLRRTWWMPAAVAFVGLFALAAWLTPYLTGNTRPVRDPAIREEVRRHAREEGLPSVPVRVMDVHEETSSPNAFAAGLGASRRIVLFDTLADRFPRRQVRVVVAHELGHLSRDHIAKGIGWFAIVALPTAFVVFFFTRRRGGLALPEAVPVALCAVVVFSLVTTPLQASVSRRYEAEADWTALQATRDPEAMERLFVNFTRRALADPDPPGWYHVLFSSHPSGRERVEMARAWAREHGAITAALPPG